MILIKCECGCHFTIEDRRFAELTILKCLNCLKEIKYTNNGLLHELISKFKGSSFKIYHLPDNIELKMVISGDNF